MQNLNARIGAHGFFCLVRASPLYNTAPRWYYTNEGIEDYLKFVVRRRWDPRLIGTQLEAFSMSGCDVNRRCIYSAPIPNPISDFVYQGTFKSKKQKIDYQTSRIRDMLEDKLGKYHIHPTCYDR